MIINKLEWLSGLWCMKNSSEEIHEHWMSPGYGVMLGINRTHKNGKTYFEYLRIAEIDNTVTYYAMPMGKQETRFELEEMGDEYVLFSNYNHDFPNRISYRLIEDQLHVTVESTGDKARSISWVWGKGHDQI